MPRFKLFTAHNAELGLELAVSQQPDMIIMDINLPGMNGLEALKHLQQDPLTQTIPVIALSANAMPRDIERGLAAGFANYLTKPIRVNEVREAIHKILGSP
jgi:CheY-like chemotaxis protein